MPLVKKKALFSALFTFAEMVRQQHNSIAGIVHDVGHCK